MELNHIIDIQFFNQNQDEYADGHLMMVTQDGTLHAHR